MLYLWGYINKKGAWISVDEDFASLLKKEGYDFPIKFHGEPKINELLENEKKGASPQPTREFLFLSKIFLQVILRQPPCHPRILITRSTSTL